jgi:hypothetical protein
LPGLGWLLLGCALQNAAANKRAAVNIGFNIALADG